MKISVVSGSVVLGLIAIFIVAFVSVPADSPFSRPLDTVPISAAAALQRAEEFIYRNGYTDAPQNEIQAPLDAESLEWFRRRKDILELRANTLQPKAVGIRRTDSGWGVAFDYVDSYPTKVRVVAMDLDGGNVRVQHQDGIREYWAGFEQD